MEVFNPKYGSTINSYRNYGLNGDIDENTPLIGEAYNSKISDTTNPYSLLDDEHKIVENVGKLMKLSNNLSMTVENKANNANIRLYQDPLYHNTTHYGWYKATWKTCLSDLKSRKFTCTNVIYDTSSESTGRIVEMQFEEL